MKYIPRLGKYTIYYPITELLHVMPDLRINMASTWTMEYHAYSDDILSNR